MSDLRIRSEAVPDTVWPQSFLPPAVYPGREIEAGDDSDFGPFLIAVARALGQLFGVAVEVLPGRPPKPVGNEPVPRVAPVLAALLATAQLGGDVAKAVQAGAPPMIPGAGAGVTMARQARTIAETLDGVAARLWPLGSPRCDFDLDIAIGAVAGHARAMAPERPPAAPVLPVAALATRLFELPMRVRVELSSAMMMVSALLPLRPGTVLPIEPSPEMPLILGDHHVGRAVVAPLPDGRQQATIVAIGVEALGMGSLS